MTGRVHVIVRIFFTASIAVAMVLVLLSPYLLRRHHPARAQSAATIAASSPHAAPPADSGSPPPSAPTPDDRTRRKDESGSATDLYGNDVTSAVARYATDPSGSVYEQHSPETELPRLPPPKS